jgi:hypothetical protein
MSDPRVKGPLSVIAVPLADAMAQHRASTPLQKNLTRAGGGAFLLTGCAYAASWSPVFLGGRFDALMDAFVHDPAHPPVALAVWAGVGAFGLLWLWVGVRGARGPRDVMAAFWSAVRVALCVCALVRQWYLPRDYGDWVLLGNLVLRGLYLCLLAEGAVHFLLAVRGPGGGNAASLVGQQIRRTSILWRIGRRQKF